MKNRSRFALWLGVSGAVGFAVIVAVGMAVRPKAPVYQGKTLYEWASRYRAAETNWASPKRKEEMETSSAAIRAIGTNALPFAMDDVSAFGGIWKYDQVRWLAYQARIFFKLRNPDRLGRGMTVLKILGPAARPSLPDLIANANEGQLFSADALMDVGPAALPAFTNLLNRPRPAQTGAIVNALVGAIINERISPEEASITVPSLVKLYTSRDNPAWLSAAQAMGFIHQQPELCVPLLGKDLSDTNADVRKACVFALGLFGDHATNYIADIVGLFNGSDERTRMQICIALAMFRSGANVAVPMLVEGVRDPAERVRESAAFALGVYSAEPDVSVPALQAALKDSASGVRCASANSLGRFGLRAASAIPALEQNALDANAQVRAVSTNALRLIRDGQQ